MSNYDRLGVSADGGLFDEEEEGNDDNDECGMEMNGNNQVHVFK